MDIQNDPETLVYTILADKKHVARHQLTRDKRFRDDLALSSMDALEIILLVEDSFHIDIPDEESEQLVTVGDLIDDVNRRVHRRQQSPRRS